MTDIDNLEAYADELRTYIETEDDRRYTSDGMLALEGVKILNVDLDGGTLGDMTDSCECCEDTCGLHYVLPEDEGAPTLCIRDGIVYVGPIDVVRDRLNAEYAEKHNKTICSCCGSFEPKRTGKADCDNCGNLVDATETLSSAELDANLKAALPGFTEIEDGDYSHVWLLDERLPTHETPANHSYVFCELTYMDEHERNPDPRYYGEIKIVNVGMAGKKAVAEMLAEYGIDGKVEKQWIANGLRDRGICATVIQESGNSKIDVLRRIAARMPEIMTFGGFVLDRPRNAIGSTGWDFMSGDILAGLNRGR